MYIQDYHSTAFSTLLCYIIASEGRRPELAFIEFRGKKVPRARVSLTSSFSQNIEIMKLILDSADAQMFNK